MPPPDASDNLIAIGGETSRTGIENDEDGRRWAIALTTASLEPDIDDATDVVCEIFADSFANIPSAARLVGGLRSLFVDELERRASASGTDVFNLLRRLAVEDASQELEQP